jgi:SAM-dependent methyltransferase
MTSTAGAIRTWHNDPEREDSMGTHHGPMWRHFIDLIPECDLSTKTVLDFGCNQGGFLRTLYAMRPFSFGLGVDIAVDSIRRANELKGDMPVDYRMAEDLGQWSGRFDIAFSYEVLYLLPDLTAHAQQIREALREGGVYYAVIGCHTGNPLWPRWRGLIGETTSLPVQDYSLEDFASAFLARGFQVAARKFGYDGFCAVDEPSGHYTTVMERLTYADDVKVLFRMARMD